MGADYPELWPAPVQAGRFLEPQDRLQRRKVIVLGDRVAHRLFDEPGRAVGSVVSAGSLQLQVVGVMAARDSRSADGSDERTCYLPHELYRSIYRWDPAVGPHVPEIALRAATRRGSASRSPACSASWTGCFPARPRCGRSR